MAITTVASDSVRSADTSEDSSYRFALVAMTSLFFMWGFITCLNDILIPHLKSVFDLSYTRAMLIQFCFFGAYFVMSLPAGALVHRIGYKRGLVCGLMIAGLGCVLFYPAAVLRVYALFLGALFVLASGITLLQVAANPYVTALGPVKTASSRLNLTQAFNALGTTVAPFFGGFLILSAAAIGVDQLASGAPQELAEFRGAEADAVKMPYLLIAGTLFALAGIFAALKLPALHDTHRHVATPVGASGKTSAWHHPHLTLGALGIFVYVGAEVAIGSFLVNFLGEPDIAGLSEAKAASFVAYYWGGAMLGRFVGSAVMRHVDPARVLAFNACAAALLVATAMLGSGGLAMYAILLVGLCNSIMFPATFCHKFTPLKTLFGPGSDRSLST